MSSKAKDKGCIHVHNKELCAELVLESGAEQYSRNKSSDGKHEGSVESSTSPKGSDKPVVSVKIPSSTGHVNEYEWLANKAKRAVVSLPDSPEMKRLKSVCNALLKREQELISELNDFLEGEDSQQQSKREMLYKKWSERVFAPIHTQLCDNMHGDGYNTIDSRKRQLFEDYLTYRNQRAVFLDTIGDEYQPVAQLSTPLKVKTSKLNDPLLSQQVEADTEEDIVRGCADGFPPAKQKPCLGRKDTNPVLWLAMELVHVDSEVRSNRYGGLKNIRNVSQWGQGDDEGKGDGAVHEELKLPHKKRITYDRQPFVLDWKENS